MEEYNITYFGFVYIWYDTKRKKFIIGSHYGDINDGYKTTTGGKYVVNIFRSRPHTMKRKILEYLRVDDCTVLKSIEQKYLDMRPNIRNNNRYYNIRQTACGFSSEESSKLQRKLVADGTHNFLGGAHVRSLVERGDHYFQSEEHSKRMAAINIDKAKRGEHISQIMVRDGSHHFLGGEIQRQSNLKRVKEGTHNFQSKEHRDKVSEIAKKRCKDGTHHFAKSEFNKVPIHLKCSDGRVWEYASKVDAVRDGFKPGAIDKVKKYKEYKFVRGSYGGKISFKKGDVLYLC